MPRDPQGIADHLRSVLAERLAPEDAAWAAERVRQEFAGDRVYFSLRNLAGLQARNSDILAARQRGETVAQIAETHNLSERQVQRVLATMN